MRESSIQLDILEALLDLFVKQVMVIYHLSEEEAEREIRARLNWRDAQRRQEVKQ